MLVACVVALAAFEKHVRWLSDNSFWEVILSPDVPVSLRVAVTLAVLLGAAALWRLMRPSRVRWLPWAADARRHYAALGGVPPARADGFVWGEAERAGIAFRRVGRVLLALGDPAGADSDRVSAVWKLRDLAQQEGLDPAIWNAGESLLKVYAALGLSAVPLGRDGMPADGGGSQHFLMCVAEHDLPALLPTLTELADDAPQHAIAE